MGISKIYYVESNNLDYKYNLDIEKILFENCKEEEFYIFIYQTNKENLTYDNKKIYSDEGCLNYSFISNKNNNDLSRELIVVRDAINTYGAYSYIDNKNILIADLNINNLYIFKNNKNILDKGVLYFDAKLDNIDSSSKYENLSNFIKNFKVDEMKKAIKQAVTDVFWLPIIEVNIEDIK